MKLIKLIIMSRDCNFTIMTGETGNKGSSFVPISPRLQGKNYRNATYFSPYETEP